MLLCLSLCLFAVCVIGFALFCWGVYRALRALWRLVTGTLSLLRTLAQALVSGLVSLFRRPAPRRVVREVPTFRTEAAKAAARAVLH